MSLYDIMNKKPVEAGRKARGIVEQPKPVEPVAAPVVVTEEKAPVVPVQAVQEAPKAVQSTETPQKKPYTHWWQTPEYLGEVNRRAADAEKRAEQDRKRAVRQRNAAILGDLAKLGAQMYAKEGGATRVDQFTPATEKANDKLAALRERHAAEVAAFAKERAAARQAEAADRKKRNLTEAQMEQAEQERRANADYRRQQVENEKERIKIAQQNALAKPVTTSSRVGSNKSLPVVFPDGTRKAYTKDELGENWINLAYEEAVEAGMPRLMNHRIKYNSRGRRTGLMEEEETNAKKRLAAIQQWSYENSLRNTAKVPVQKKANPMGSGKKANPMN